MSTVMKAFSCETPRQYHIVVEADGTVLVWDEAAGAYTRCHAPSDRAQASARRLRYLRDGVGAPYSAAVFPRLAEEEPGSVQGHASQGYVLHDPDTRWVGPIAYATREEAEAVLREAREHARKTGMQGPYTSIRVVERRALCGKNC